MPRRFPSLALAVLGLAAAPAGSQAAVTIGSNLTGTGTNGPGGCNTICTGANLNLPAANAAPNGLTSPINGVVVRWRVKSASTGNTVALRVLRPTGGTTFTGAGTSASGTTNGDVSPFFPTRLTIRVGDSIGLNPSNSALVWSNNAGATVAHWSVTNGFPNGLADGSSGAGATSNQELLVQAVVEPDADGDGFGDETQDACPGDPARQAPPCAAGTPTVLPAVTGLRVSPRSVRQGSRATIRFRLSRASRWTLRFQQRRAGRRRGSRCRLQTRVIRTGRRCTVYTSRGTVSGNGGPGGVSVVFRGGLPNRRALPIGVYRITATAKDAAGTSAPKRTFLTLKPKLRRR